MDAATNTEAAAAYEAWPSGGQPRAFEDAEEAIAWVQGFEAGEVREIATDLQVWAHWPQAKHSRY